MWKQIDNKYSISDNGLVRNDKSMLILKPETNSKGYLRISLGKKHYFIHRLVAISFIPNPLNKPQVNHIDNNKLNNHYSNLEWVTNAENQQHAYISTNSTKRLVTKEQYEYILKCTSEGLKPKDIVKLTGLNRNTIVAVRQGYNNKRFN